MLTTAASPDKSEQSPSKSRFSTGVNPVRIDTDAAISPLLARANLLKLRGQWEEAVAVCTEAIRRSPDSAAAHALLGDIYLAQGHNGDAIHWYRMALDRDPIHHDLAEKHNKLIAEQKAIATGGFTAASLGGANRTFIPGELRASDDRTARLHVRTTPVIITTSPGRVTVEKTLDWFDRVFPQRSGQGVPRALFLISGMVTVFVLAAGAFLFFAIRRDDVQDDPNTVLSEIRPATDIAPLSAPNTNGPESATQRPSVSPSATPRMTLLESLSRLNGQEVAVTAAQADSTNGQAQLEIALASHSGETIEETRNRILQASARVTQAAYTDLPTLQRFSVRVLLRGHGTTGSLDAVNATLVFVGETSGVALRTLSLSSSPQNQTLISALFTNTWWASSLQPRMP